MMTRRHFVLTPPRTLAAAAALALGGGGYSAIDADAESARPAAMDPAPVYIVLWFDTEDYILPASDDAAKHIADFLTRQGVRATFKVVGAKARALARRHRTDVIAALDRHEIGYHANTHSQHPTVAEYESVLDWEQGAEEFDRREHAGFDDVRRIFGKTPTCYGQPGSSWAPQVFPTLKKWGVHVYLDDAPQLSLGGKPFWYGGLLNVFNIQAGKQLEPNDDWSNLSAAKDNFKALYAQLSSQAPGGLISLYFHPTQFVSLEFWDAVNFARGANPPPSAWKLQPQLSPAQRARAFQYLEGLVAYMKSFPGVRFVTASEAAELYLDSAQGHAFDAAELAQIAGQVSANISFQDRQAYTLSASEVFALLSKFVTNFVSQQPRRPLKLNGTPCGPSSPAFGMPTRTENMGVSWSQFSRTALDVSEFMEMEGAVPNAVWFGSQAVSPESFLLALAKVVQILRDKGQPPESVTVASAELAAAQYVAQDLSSTWNWIIFPPGFHSAHLMELARWQTWTLKPAVLGGAR